MTWNQLKGLHIQEVHYHGGLATIPKTGSSSPSYLLEDGLLVITTDAGVFEIDNTSDDLTGGLSIDLRDPLTAGPDTRAWNGSPWGDISDATIADIHLSYTDVQIEKGGRTRVERSLLSVELEFRHGQRIHVSAVGLAKENSLRPMLGDLLVHTQRVKEKFNEILGQ